MTEIQNPLPLNADLSALSGGTTAARYAKHVHMLGRPRTDEIFHAQGAAVQSGLIGDIEDEDTCALTMRWLVQP